MKYDLAKFFKLLLIVLPISQAFAIPPNDDLAAAIDIGNTFPYSDTQQINTASNESKAVLSSCTTHSSNNVWYQYTPITDKTVVLDTFDSNSDTVLSIWIGTSHPLIELACNDDANEEQAQSQLSMAFSAGETYYINISYSLLDESDKSVILALKATSNSTFEEMAVVGMGISPDGEFFYTNSYFISFMTTNSGLSGNNLKIDSTDEVTLSATIKIDALHIGESADILMVAIYQTEGNQEQFMRHGDIWKAWRGQIASLAAAVENKKLPETLENRVYQGPLSALGLQFPSRLTLYVGYRLENGDLIFNGIEPIDFYIQ